MRDCHFDKRKFSKVCKRTPSSEPRSYLDESTHRSPVCLHYPCGCIEEEGDKIGTDVLRLSSVALVFPSSIPNMVDTCSNRHLELPTVRLSKICSVSKAT